MHAHPLRAALLTRLYMHTPTSTPWPANDTNKHASGFSPQSARNCTALCADHGQNCATAQERAWALGPHRQRRPAKCKLTTRATTGTCSASCACTPPATSPAQHTPPVNLAQASSHQHAPALTLTAPHVRQENGGIHHTLTLATHSHTWQTMRAHSCSTVSRCA